MADDDIIRGGLDIVTDKTKKKKNEGNSRTAPAFGSAVNKTLLRVKMPKKITSTLSTIFYY